MADGNGDENTKAVPKFVLEIGGTEVDVAIRSSITLLRVRQHLEMADMLEVTLSNDDLTWTETDAFAEGKELTLKLGYEGEGGSLVQVIKAEVVRRDCEFPMKGPAVLRVVAYDKRHRLKRGVHSRVFSEMKDSEMVTKIAKEVGLTAEVEDSQTKHRYVLQNAQSNLSFIRQRAALINYEVWVDPDNTKLTFKKADTTKTAANLKRDDNLLSFSPRWTTDQQVSKVTVRGWDMTAKKEIVGTADKSKSIYDLDGADQGAKLAEAAYKNREVLYPAPVFQAAEATAIAEALMNQRAVRYCEGEGSCLGDPNILPGTKVKIDGCGERANGEYYVVETLHYFHPEEGYSTHFTFVKGSERATPQQAPPLPDPVPPRDTPIEGSSLEAKSELGPGVEADPGDVECDVAEPEEEAPVEDAVGSRVEEPAPPSAPASEVEAEVEGPGEGSA